jgi:Dna[CI] antecedent, DciA
MGEYRIQEALQQFLSSSRIQGSLRAMQISDVWAELMGPLIAEYTDKIQIIGDKLFIYTHVAPLRHELVFQRETIRTRVNEAFGESLINEVVIQ